MDRLNTHVLDFLGGVLRHALNNAVPKFLGGACPFATQIINITSSMAMGFLIGWLALTRRI